MQKAFYLLIGLMFIIQSQHAQDQKDSTYFAKMSALGTRMIPVYNGKYKVFTQKVGDGEIDLLLLHGGPGNTHEYFENFPDSLRKLGVTVYFYDQLGSYFSDTPDDSTIWNIERLVMEVEEVRVGLGLDSFYLLGHSWGGMLAELYAAKYGQHLKGLILSNVPGSLAKDPEYLDHIIDSIDIVVRYQATLLPKFVSTRAQIDSISKGFTLADTTIHKILAQQYNKANDSLFGRTWQMAGTDEKKSETCAL
jgi:pimeloyl-ACP methyl ester carboxylesterase